MAINGIETLVYGVDDVATSIRYFEDFGLPLLFKNEREGHFRLPEGSNVVIRHVADPSIPASSVEGIGVKEIVWGVDSQESLNRLIADLSRDRKLRHDADGTVHFLTDCGMALALRVFRKNPVMSAPDPVNAPGNIQRFNQPRKWRMRAYPKTIQHVVFAVQDFEKSFAFFKERLGFRLTDMMSGCGMFGRADGAYDHHHIFLLNAKLGIEGCDGRTLFHHANFGVEDIDELMIGVNHLERCGWPRSNVGLARHRLSSGLFCYLPCPAGGQAEYGADFDFIDDNWVPRDYEFVFSYAQWIQPLPAWLLQPTPWAVSYVSGFTPIAKPV